MRHPTPRFLSIPVEEVEMQSALAFLPKEIFFGDAEPQMRGDGVFLFGLRRGAMPLELAFSSTTFYARRFSQEKARPTVRS